MGCKGSVCPRGHTRLCTDSPGLEFWLSLICFVIFDKLLDLSEPQNLEPGNNGAYLVVLQR